VYTYIILVWCIFVVDKLLSLETVSDTNFVLTRQRMRDAAKLNSDDILYELSCFYHFLYRSSILSDYLYTICWYK